MFALPDDHCVLIVFSPKRARAASRAFRDRSRSVHLRAGFLEIQGSAKFHNVPVWDAVHIETVHHLLHFRRLALIALHSGANVVLFLLARHLFSGGELLGHLEMRFGVQGIK